MHAPEGAPLRGGFDPGLVGLADLVPGLHGRMGGGTGIRELLLMLAGVGTIVLFD